MQKNELFDVVLKKFAVEIIILVVVLLLNGSLPSTGIKFLHQIINR